MLLTDEEFAGAFTFRHRAFRFECQPAYPLGNSRDDFERFLAGKPRPPTECEWLAPWLDQLARWTLDGKTVSRVRVLDDPPTGYQRWLLWGARWMADAGEDNRWMPRSTAERLGLPLDDDWWVLDERVIVMRFREPASKMLMTDPASVATYRALRDVALRNALTAEHMTA